VFVEKIYAVMRWLPWMPSGRELRSQK